jgi:hypothetical protein
MAAGEALQARVRKALQTRLPLAELQALSDEAAALPAYVADVESLHSLLGKAKDWLAKAEAAASQVCLKTHGWLRHGSAHSRPAHSTLSLRATTGRPP